jgi:radical SAM protein with 4Fe4S-binding SPASM domain
LTDHPVDALLAVTYKCNARCTMCNIWRTPAQNELSPEEWSNVPPALRDINISGGEPFLREDLPSLVEVFRNRCPRARIIISSNGIGPERIRGVASLLVRIDPTIGVGISIDGIGETHDRIRGVRGAYLQATESLEILKGAGVKDLRVAFTAVEQNLDEMEDVYELSRRLEVEFSCVVAHDSEIYFRTEGKFVKSTGTLITRLNSVALKELATSSPKRWFRSYFYKGLADYLRDGRRMLPCLAGDATLFIDPTGEVYPCNVLGLSMGNIRDRAFNELWSAEKAVDVRRKVRACSRPCWMMCSARASIRENPFKAGAWVARNKAMVHLGRRSVL